MFRSAFLIFVMISLSAIAEPRGRHKSSSDTRAHAQAIPDLSPEWGCYDAKEDGHIDMGVPEANGKTRICYNAAVGEKKNEVAYITLAGPEGKLDSLTLNYEKSCGWGCYQFSNKDGFGMQWSISTGFEHHVSFTHTKGGVVRYQLKKTSPLTGPHPAAAACKAASTKEVKSKFAKKFKGETKRVIDRIECEPMKGKKSYVYCEVTASNGNGAGDIEFAVLLNAECSKAFASFITREE